MGSKTKQVSYSFWAPTFLYIWHGCHHLSRSPGCLFSACLDERQIELPPCFMDEIQCLSSSIHRKSAAGSWIQDPWSQANTKAGGLFIPRVKTPVPATSFEILALCLCLRTVLFCLWSGDESSFEQKDWNVCPWQSWAMQGLCLRPSLVYMETWLKMSEKFCSRVWKTLVCV